MNNIDFNSLIKKIWGRNKTKRKNQFFNIISMIMRFVWESCPYGNILKYQQQQMLARTWVNYNPEVKIKLPLEFRGIITKYDKRYRISALIMQYDSYNLIATEAL